MANRRRQLKLTTGAEVRRAISRIANMTLNGEIDSKVANTLLYACNAALAAIKTDEQQHKLNELEQLLTELQAEHEK